MTAATCETCGVALDGRVRRPQQIVLLHDGAMAHGGTYCAEHAGDLVTAFRVALRELADEADARLRVELRERFSIRVDSVGGEA